MNISGILAEKQVIDRQNNYGQIFPATEFGNTVREGQDALSRLKGALDTYNKSKSSKQRLLDSGLDHYAHRYITYRASQKSPLLGATMLGAGVLKEIPDFIKYSFKNGVSKAWDESRKDLTEDWRGYKMGKTSKLKPEENPEFNKYNSATVKKLLDVLK